MTTKPKLKVDWPSVIKGGIIILTALGTVGTGTVMLGGNDTEAKEIKPMVVQHIATDSVRWIYTEKRLERMEKDLQTSLDIQRQILSEVRK